MIGTNTSRRLTMTKKEIRSKQLAAYLNTRETINNKKDIKIKKTEDNEYDNRENERNNNM